MSSSGKSPTRWFQNHRRISHITATSKRNRRSTYFRLRSEPNHSHVTAESQPHYSHITITAESQPHHTRNRAFEKSPVHLFSSSVKSPICLCPSLRNTRRKLFLKQFRKKYTLELRLRSQRVWSRPEQVSSVLAAILLQAIDDFTSQSDTSRTSRSLPPATKVNCVLAARRSIDLTHLRSACAQALRNRPVRLCQAVRNRRSAYFRVAAESQSNHSHITPESQLSHLPNHSHITGSQPSHGHMTADHSHKTADLQPISVSGTLPINLFQGLRNRRSTFQALRLCRTEPQATSTAESQPHHNHITITAASEANHSHITPKTEPLRSR